MKDMTANFCQISNQEKMTLYPLKHLFVLKFHRQTRYSWNTHTHQKTTVCLAAHAHRGIYNNNGTLYVSMKDVDTGLLVN